MWKLVAEIFNLISAELDKALFTPRGGGFQVITLTSTVPQGLLLALSISKVLFLGLVDIRVVRDYQETVL
jgi:hypothetical protein